MVDIVNTAELRPGQLDVSRNLWVYNGLDCCLTAEVFEMIRPQLLDDSAARLAYNFEMATRAPAMEMATRGILVDHIEQRTKIDDYQVQEDRLKWISNQYIEGPLGWSKDKSGWRLNPNSPAKLQFFFYDVLGLPYQHTFTQGKRKITTNDDAMKQFLKYPEAAPHAAIVIADRQIRKKISTLKSGVDDDMRMRFSYNVAATETLRWSSSKNVFGRGTNSQNITNELRRIFVADEGKKFGYLDLSSAESYIVGLMAFIVAGDSAYLDACSSGDIHTYVAKMVWPDMPWTGVLAEDKQLAENTKIYRHFSARDLAKVLGHGTNYMGTPRTMAKHAMVETAVIQEFQDRYFLAFPGIRAWHAWTAEQIQLYNVLTTPMGIRRRFFGHRDDKATLREAVAFIPQSTVATILNLGMWRIWKHAPHLCQLMSQLHDAVLVQYDTPREKGILPQLLKLMEVPVKIKGRTLTIPIDAKVGWNWEETKKPEALVRNPDGLIGWKDFDPRQRVIPAKRSFMDLRL